MKKSSLFKRIKWAAEAFKNGPLPVLKEPPVIIKTTRSLKVVAACVDYRFCDFGIVPNAKEQIAHRIADELLRGDCIMFTEDAQEMRLYGRVYVSAPEEEVSQ